MARTGRKSFKVAVVGATGLVGQEMLSVLAERKFPISSLVMLASTRTAGSRLSYEGREYQVGIATADALDGAEIVLMSAGADTSRQLALAFADKGAVVIDNSSAWRMDKDVPLVVPEVNPKDIANYTKRGIIANPNCSTIQMVVALAPLHQHATLKRVVVSTYQAVSGKGKEAIDEMSSQISALFNQGEIETKVFPKRIAFNCLPHINVFDESGFTFEEQKMQNETRKILHLPDLGVCATCVRVPVFNGHAESVLAEFEKPIFAAEARKILRQSPGIMLMDEPENNIYPTQLDAEGTDATYVGRVREDKSAANSLAFWCVADNLRKGAATNAVQIAEILARDYL
ncbi:MAG: aspartate-semialdehyde dehydrogenase [Deltaproteobacteria bacterium RIFOXYA12_FULL_58_15]|nr:MAG: aspartate-semialdehyde dehydrogenase [Deltaproteobacteria bacterium RIFOXYA12_FULL_58_15]OGR13386.1 MAG: aspartate-semialdehyde dehydrogenase [Deltaproteobacteria bacterium RIFOXYB12_FULL_58_9]